MARESLTSAWPVSEKSAIGVLAVLLALPALPAGGAAPPHNKP